jgi:hypothetical protein
MKGRRVIFICNALEDITRIERNIYSDSPAASKKIFQMANALRSVGERSIILSMGRGRPDGSVKYYKSKVMRIDGLTIIYAPFSQIPVFSQILSVFFLPVLLFRLNGFHGKTSAIFYNRTSAYISSLLTCILVGFARILDLEDEDLPFETWSLYNIFLSIKRSLYDCFCSGGTIIACRAFSNPKAKRQSLCYYGAVSNFREDIFWGKKQKYKFLMGGTVSIETGALLLVETIKLIRNNDEHWADKLEFIITGKGDCIKYFDDLSSVERPPFVRVMGRLKDSEYSEILHECDVGLALKPNTGLLADTTFPSKVIELSSEGLLVLTTNISDVKLVFGSGALYLENDRIETLFESFKWIVKNPQLAESVARSGAKAVKSQCEIGTAGIKLARYIFND